MVSARVLAEKSSITRSVSGRMLTSCSTGFQPVPGLLGNEGTGLKPVLQREFNDRAVQVLGALGSNAIAHQRCAIDRRVLFGQLRLCAVRQIHLVHMILPGRIQPSELYG